MRYLIFATVATLAAYAEKPAGPVSSEDEYLVVTGSASSRPRGDRQDFGSRPRDGPGRSWT